MIVALSFPIHTISTTPFSDQRPGTSGLRKKTRIFQKPHYLENFVQSVFNVLTTSKDCNLAEEVLVLGGDGRFFNRPAIQTILKMAVANNVGMILVGQGGLLSTPAMSAIIRQRQAIGGILLTASHNPGGQDEDFGIKYNTRNGGPAPEHFTDLIFRQTQNIRKYVRVEAPAIDLDAIGSTHIRSTTISIIDPLADYTALMERLFDFDHLRDFFASGRRILFDAMHGVTGPYATHIFNHCLLAPKGTVIRATPLENFGGVHPDPNLVHAANLLRQMNLPDAADVGAACDGDGDRNLIAGRNMFVSPGDSLAIIADCAQTMIPGYHKGLDGVARSMPTSTAIDRVAAHLKIPCYETPTGWKYFGNLMDAGLCTLCGEESFGTGSNHVREKDGLWAVLAWISILASSGRSVSEIINQHWKQFGRSYYQRHDFEGLNNQHAADMVSELASKLPDLPGTTLAGCQIRTADNFKYTDPVDGSVTTQQGIRLILEDGSRIVARLSGTGTEGATLRLYAECFRETLHHESLDRILAPLVEGAIHLLEMKRFCNRDRATVVT